MKIRAFQKGGPAGGTPSFCPTDCLGSPPPGLQDPTQLPAHTGCQAEKRLQVHWRGSQPRSLREIFFFFLEDSAWLDLSYPIKNRNTVKIPEKLDFMKRK